MANGNGAGFVTRGVVLTLDPSPAQERLLWSYCGSARLAYNWAIGAVSSNLAQRRGEREAGIAEEELTAALSWSAFSLGKAWNEAKDEVAPWWREVSMHAFRSGTTAASAALANFSASKKGARAGRRVRFPRPKTRRRSMPSVSFVEINHQLSWIGNDRHHLRLMLPQSTPDRDVSRRREHLSWIHTTESTRRLYKLVETGRARIQKVTISHRGGRWQAAFTVRYLVSPGLPSSSKTYLGRAVGIDAGLRHLLTLSVPVRGLTDPGGHVENPKVLDAHLRRLRYLDRAIARCERGSKNRAKLLKRRSRLHGQMAKTRSLELHRVTNQLLRRFDIIGIENLNVAGMGTRRGRLGRAVADASLGELRRQITYKVADRRSTMIMVDRFYPSSKTCSSCGSVKAKLDRSTQVFDCDTCGSVLDRDVNAARNIEREAIRLLVEQHRSVAGLRPETQNADPRPRKTQRAHAPTAAVA
jgi:putative transposase